MAKIVNKNILVSVSKLVKNDSEEVIELGSNDLASLNTMLEEIMRDAFEVKDCVVEAVIIEEE